MADVEITGIGFRVLLGVVSLAVVAGLALVWRRRAGRVATALVALVLVVANAAAGVNAHFDYFRTLGDAAGLPPSDEVALAQLLLRRDRPAAGVVTSLGVPGARSGFAARPALVYVPPAWFDRPRPELPVLVLLHGTPGQPRDWVDGGRAAATADRYAAAHGGTAPLLVMPDINGDVDADTECVDGPPGNAETYLTADVPAFVQRTFRTRAPGRAWAVAGLSEGGSCALMLALRHPTLFGTFGDFSGLAGPRTGDTNADTATAVAGLFGGSPAAFAAHEPAAILAARRLPASAGWFEVGDADPEPAAAQAALVPAAAAAGVRTCAVVVPGGGHTFDVFSAALSDSLPWLVARVTPGATPPPCPS